MQTNEKMSYQIRRCYASLRKSEQKVADYVLNHEAACRRISLETLAEQSGVSQPTVVRFVKALGFQGFKEFRYKLMENAVTEARSGESQAMYGYNLNPDEKLKLIPAKVVATSVRTLEDMLKSISGEQFEKMIHMIAGARTIAITNFRESRISQFSDVVMCCSQEQWLYGDCIFSRTTQIVLNDMIYMGLIAGDYDNRTEQLDKNSRLISDKAYQ